MAAATTTLTAEQQLQLLQKLLNGPGMAPPPGVKPNFVNPPNLEKEFYIDLILCLTISVLVVAMRMWTKVRVMRKVMIEDCKRKLTTPRFFCFFLVPSFLFLSLLTNCQIAVFVVLNWITMEGLYKIVYIRGLCISTCKYWTFPFPSPVPRCRNLLAGKKKKKKLLLIGSLWYGIS